MADSDTGSLPPPLPPQSPSRHAPKSPIASTLTSSSTTSLQKDVALTTITPPEGEVYNTPLQSRPHTPPPLLETSSQPPSTPSAASLANLASRDSIRRKPVPVTTYDSSLTLRELAAADGTRSSTPKNPLDKVAVLVVPEQLGSKSPTCSPSGETPRTHIVLKGRGTKKSGQKSAGKAIVTNVKALAEGLVEVKWKEVWHLWWIEMAFWGLSALFVIIIFAILSAYDQKPYLTTNVHLPSLLSILTTLFLLAVAIPLTSALSQCKWNYFSSEDRSLLDFEMFDSASRSPLWASVLLMRLKHRNLGSLGALIFVVGLLTPAITQLAVGVSEKMAQGSGGDGGEATLLARQELGNNEEFDWAGTVRMAIQGRGTYDAEFKPECPNGDCQFPEIETLAICSETTNISDKLTIVSNLDSTSSDAKNSSSAKQDHSKSIRQPVYNASLPEVARCQIGTDSPFSIITCKTQGSQAIGGLDGVDKGSVLFSMPMIYSIPENGNDSLSNSSFQALEIVLYLCANTYSVAVKGGSPAAKFLSSSSRLASDSADREVGVTCDVPSLNQTDSPVKCDESKDIPDDAYMALQSSKSNRKPFKASFKALEDIAVGISSATSGIYLKKADGDGNEQVQTKGPPEMKTISEIIYSGEQDPQSRAERISEMADRMSARLTTALIPTSASDYVSTVSGTALSSLLVISVSYSYLTLLILHLVSVLIFLFLVATTTQINHKTNPVLKSSSLGTLFALEDDCRIVAGGLEMVPGMKRKARVMRVKMSEGGENLCFVDRRHEVLEEAAATVAARAEGEGGGREEGEREGEDGSLRGSTRHGERLGSQNGSPRGKNDEDVGGENNDVEKKDLVARSDSARKHD